ncbi:hypothetical protein [Ktedonospora formicarum]|nr:hypothetical protein [Ktedonospora formicarum]
MGEKEKVIHVARLIRSKVIVSFLAVNGCLVTHKGGKSTVVYPKDAEWILQREDDEMSMSNVKFVSGQHCVEFHHKEKDTYEVWLDAVTFYTYQDEMFPEVSGRNLWY